MILQKEIKDAARLHGVPLTTIDKDWALGHLLKAIYSTPGLNDKIVFKGGTCLRKCYIEDYRFSEDLDFTSNDGKFELTKKMLERLCSTVQEHSEMLIRMDMLRPLHFNNVLTGYEAKLKFWGADHPKNQEPPTPDRLTTAIKLEIILFEKIIFPAENRTIIHPYSDHENVSGTKALCYSIEEIMTEKLRALIQRAYTAPRDYFDIWYLVNHYPGLNWENINKGFFEKAKFKKLAFNSHEEFLTDAAVQHLTRHWGNTLKHQLNPEMYVEPDVVIDFCKKLFKQKFSRYA